MSDVPSRLTAALQGRYAIERPLGEGGMATVYLATDLRHNRQVALKVLKPELAAVVGAERFLAEIETTANLQHPHILPLYDSGEADSFLFYVMPYVEGESLRDRLDREKQLSIEETIRITKAVAGALDFAHRKGVVHRDIKPANILLQDGQPLVADFGIALAVAQAGGGRLTETGLSLGTPYYMSPEQATADRDPDARSDLYSLACVVYEMLTGEPPYLGSSVQAVLARILTETPRPARATRSSVPPHVDAALEKALQKLPADRFDTAADFMAALEGRVTVDTGPVPAASGSTVGGGPGPRRGWLAAVGALALAVGAAGGWLLHRPTALPPPPVVRMYVQGDSTYAVTNMCCGPSLAISRDGARLVFMAQVSDGRMLYRRDMSDVEAHPIPGTEDGHTPFLDPTGRWLGFASEGHLKKVDLSGGTPISVADLGTSRIWGATWGDDGFMYFGSESDSTPGIFRVSAEGGTPELFSAPDTSVEAARVSPCFLPGGRGLLYVSWPETGGDSKAWVAVLDLKDRSTHRLTQGIQPYYADGHLVYALADGSIMARPFDLKTLQVDGPVTRIGSNVITHNASDTEYAISASGTLVTRHGGGTGGGTVGTGGSMSRLFVYSLTGAVVGSVESESQQLPRGMPTVSPNGRYVAFVQTGNEGESIDLWVFDRTTRLDSRLSAGRGGYAISPVWSADSREVRWLQSDPAGTSPGNIPISSRSTMGSEVRLMSRPVDLSGPPVAFGSKEVSKPGDGEKPVLLGLPSRSGGPIPFTVEGPKDHGDDLWIMDSDGTDPRPFLQTPANEANASVSPSGKWIAYTSDETGEAQVWVQPFPGGGPRFRISSDRGDDPVWISDHEIAFVSRYVAMLADLDTSGGQVRPTGYHTLVNDVSLDWGARPLDATPDGHGVVVASNSGTARLLVETNRLEHLGSTAQ